MQNSFKVFLCSTYSDLVSEREGVLEAIRKLKLQHESMEYFGARPDQPLDACLQEVRQSDILIVIVGHRYGSISIEHGLSFSEMEYNEGYRLRKPCLIYIRGDDAPITARQIETDPEKLFLLKNFKKKLSERHTIASFQSKSDLSVSVVADLSRLIQKTDLNDYSGVESVLSILRQGHVVWNTWRLGNQETEINLNDLDLRGWDLNGANLKRVNFSNSNLSKALLHDADLRVSNFRQANLSEADLSSANFSFADLSNSNLSKSNLKLSNFTGSTLNNTNFDGAYLGETIFVNVNLGNSVGLELCQFRGECTLNTKTIALSNPLPGRFLRGCGLSEWEIEMTKLYQPGLSADECTNTLYRIDQIYNDRPIQIRNLFISYSRADSSFVDALEPCLNNAGIRFWRDIHDTVAGPLESQITLAIENAIILLILSKKSVESSWVEYEATVARRTEVETSRIILCPVALDDSWKNCSWPVSLRQHIERYNILDFSNWKIQSFMERQCKRLIDGLDIYYKPSE